MTTVQFPDMAEQVVKTLFQPHPGADALPGGDWSDDVVTQLVRFRLSTSGLADACRDAAVDPQAIATLRSASYGDLALDAQLVRRAVGMQQILTDEGIDSLGVKGIAVRDLHDPQHPRRFGDIDLLVRPERFVDAVEVFRARGYVMAGHEGWSRWAMEAFIPGCNLNDDSFGEVDIQRVPSPWRLGCRLDFEELWTRSRKVTVAGGEVRVVGPEDALLMACMSMLSDWGTGYSKLWPWKDLVVLAEVADRDLLAGICREKRLSWVVREMLEALPAEVRPTPLLSVLGHAGPGPFDRIRRGVLMSPTLRSHWIVENLPPMPAHRAVGLLVRNIVHPLGSTRSLAGWWRHAVSGAFATFRRA